MNITFDSRDWYQKGEDPTPSVAEAMRVLWEAGLQRDVKLVVSSRLYEIVKETDYGALAKEQSA